MGNNSSTGGQLLPAPNAPGSAPWLTNTDGSSYVGPLGSYLPPEDGDLDDVFAPVIAGITGLTGDMVRPLIQDTNPQYPPAGTNWIAFGSSTAQCTPQYIQHGHTSGGVPYDMLIVHETIKVECQCFGNNAGAIAAMLRDGIRIPQNTETLKTTQDMAFAKLSGLRRLRDLQNNVWVRRADIDLYFNRNITRYYAIEDIASVIMQLIDDTGKINRTLTATP